MKRVVKHLGILSALLAYGCTSGSETKKSEVKPTAASGDATVGRVSTITSGIELDAIALVEVDEDSTKLIPLRIGTTTTGSLRIEIMDSPKHGEVQIDAANASLKYSPDPDYSGRDNFSVRVIDGSNASTARPVSIKVNPVDDAPICLSQIFGAKTATEIRASIACQDIDDSAVEIWISKPPVNGSATLSRKDFVYTLAAGQTADDEFEIKARSNGKESKPGVIKISPNLVGEKPVASALSVSCREDEQCNVVLSASSNIPNQGFHYEVTSPPRQIPTELNIATGVLTFRLSENWSGTDEFRYRARSGDKWSDEVTVPIGVDAVNDLPVIALAGSIDPIITIDEDTTREFSYELSDIELNALDVIVSRQPEHGLLSLDLDRNRFSFRPNENFNGSDTFSLSACERGSEPAVCSTPLVIEISVNPVNDSPRALSPFHPLTEDSPERICFEKDRLAVDVDNNLDEIVMSPMQAPGVTIETTRICYVAPSNFNGIQKIAYSVQDPAGLSSNGEITVTVAGVEDPTEFVTSSLACAITEDQTEQICTIRASDADGLVSYTLGNNDALISKGWLIDVDRSNQSDGGRIKITPPLNYFGNEKINVRAGSGELTNAELTVTVNNVYDAPTWISTPDTSSLVLTSTGTSWEWTFKAMSVDRLSLQLTGVQIDRSTNCEMTTPDPTRTAGELRVRITCPTGQVQYRIDVNDGTSAQSQTFSGTVYFSDRAGPTSVGNYWRESGVGSGTYQSTTFRMHSINSCLSYLRPFGTTKVILDFDIRSEQGFDYLSLFYNNRSALITRWSGSEQKYYEATLPATATNVDVCFSKDSSVHGSRDPEAIVRSVRFR